MIDNGTGAVRAIANRVPYNAITHTFDVATGDGSPGKQPGSGFKTFTLAAALASGYSPNDYSVGGNCTFNYPQSTQLTPYNVTSDGQGGPLTLDIADSINCSFVRLEISMGWGTAGPKKVATMANTLGLDRSFAPSEFQTSLTLGTIGVTPLQMASAYSTLANNGVRHRPVYVTRIVASDGTVLYNRPGGAPGTPVVSPQLAQTETQMLEGVITQPGATGTKANIGRPAAGKTGTTTNGTDLWFTGYTPQLTASVWVGVDGNAESPLYPTYMSESQAFGGSISAPIWKNFMQAALLGQPVLQFTPPDPSQWPPTECVSAAFPPGRTRCYVPAPPPPANTTPTTVAGKGKGKKGKPPKHGGNTTPTSTPPTTAGGGPPH